MENKKSWKFCQSCTMPLNKDPKEGGTEADGRKSAKYCSYCYENGQFKDGGMELEEYLVFIDQKMKESGVGRIIRWLAKKQIPKAERWKKQ